MKLFKFTLAYKHCLTLWRIDFFFMNFGVCGLWWCSDGSINNHEYKSFEINAVSIMISITKYRHWTNRQTYGLWFLTQQSMGEISMVIPVTCLFPLFEALNDAFEVFFFFQGFIFRPYQRHWYHVGPCRFC